MWLSHRINGIFCGSRLIRRREDSKSRVRAIDAHRYRGFDRLEPRVVLSPIGGRPVVSRETVMKPGSAAYVGPAVPGRIPVEAKGIQSAVFDSAQVTTALGNMLSTQYANDLNLEDVERIAEFGFKSIRFVFIPHERGWDYYDVMVHDIWEKGLTPILILFSANSMNSFEERQRIVEVAAQGASRYSEGPVLWDVWNEPTSPRFWNDHVNADVFADFASRVIDAISWNAPAHQIMMPSIPRIDKRNKDFLFGIFDRRPDLLAKIDFVSVHLYGQYSGRNVTTPETLMQNLAKFRGEFASRYGVFIPMVVSEMGWHTVGGGSVSVVVAAQFSVRLFLSGLVHGIPLVVQYQWRDAPEEVGVAEPGIQSIKYVPRPAYHSLRGMVLELKDHKFVKTLKSGSDNALLFVDQSGTEKVVVWNTNGRSPVIRLRSMEGRMKSIGGVTGTPRFVTLGKEFRLS